MDLWNILVSMTIIIQITCAVKCPTGCSCHSLEFQVSVSCAKEPYYVTTIPQMPQNTTKLQIDRCDIPEITDMIFYLNGGQFLNHINLAGSRLQFISQNAFGNLEELELVNLDYNFLGSLIGTEFSPLSNLQSLGIRHSHLQEIPQQSMCNMQHIQRVFLMKNEIKRLKLDPCFQHLFELRHLDMSGNPLHKILHTDFLPLKDIALSGLVLDDCKLEALENNVFIYLIKLRVLSLQKNKLERLPRLPAGLHALYISGNNLKLIDDHVYGNLIFLHVLQIDNIGVTHAHFGAGFKNLLQLHFLSLKKNVLNQLLKSDFVNLEVAQIQTLIIDQCKVQSIEAGTFQKLYHLQYLSLIGNGLTAKALEIGLSMASWENLETLHIEINHLTDIDGQTFRSITQSRLRFLNMMDANINGIVPRGAFQNLEHLKWLSLDGAGIKDLEAESFINSSNVKNLSISNNKLTSFPPHLDIPLLEYLSLSWNRGITTIRREDLKWYPNLRTLDLSHCSLETIGKETFTFNRKLSKLMLNANNLAMSLTPGILLNLDNLEDLRLSDNKDINIFDVQAFGPIPNIIHLQLNFLHILGRNTTKLSESLQNLTHLESLELSSIEIDTIPRTMLQNMKKLSKLVLSNNWITQWKPEVFKSQRHLTTLIMAFNKITVIDRRALWYLPSLRILDLSKNPFMCTCDLLSFRLWMDTDSGAVLTGMNQKTNYKCLTPPALRGTFLLDYKPTEESCMSYTLYITILVVTMTYSITVTCATMLYRYWWYIR